MSESIAGYIDKSYIKGQYYRYAASPKPVVFTGNIDTMSEDLLVKTMLVSTVTATGTFPTDVGTNFLISTVKYGDDIYLQVAYLLLTDSSMNCYEYRRIYTNSAWTDWISTDGDLTTMNSKIQEAKDTADNCASGLQSANSQISTLNSQVSTLNNRTVPNLNNSVSAIDSRLKAVETRTANCGKRPQSLCGYVGSGMSATLSNAYNTYSQYIVVAKVQNVSDASLVTQTILRNQIFQNDTSFCMSDEVWYVSYFMRYSGNDVILTFRKQNKEGYITAVYGIY